MSVSVAQLLPPLYPPLAKQVRVTGNALLTLVVRADGNIESATVVSGHPLLKQAALDSAQHSQFACEACDKEPRSFQMTYSFQLGPAVYCAESSVSPKTDEQQEFYPRVTQSQNHVVIYDRPIGTCDVATTIEKKVFHKVPVPVEVWPGRLTRRSTLTDPS